MTESLSPKVAADKARDTYRKTAAQTEELVHDTPLPGAMRALAEKNIAQTREACEHSKHALEAALETLERSFDAVGQGAIALNHKVMDIAQRDMNSGFDLAKSLAGKISPRSSNCKLPIGASSSAHSRPKQRRCASSRLR